MVRKSGQQGVPVIAVDDQIVVGFDRPRLERLLASAKPTRPTFGAAVADAASYLAKRGQVPVFGALVGNVKPGSPAARIGLESSRRSGCVRSPTPTESSRRSPAPSRARDCRSPSPEAPSR
jgi:S1-C subfamily serine protease